MTTFNDWFDEIEVWSARSERFWDDFNSRESVRMTLWLTAAYDQGSENAASARVEQLEAACWRMQEQRDRAVGWRDSDQLRGDTAEAKLAKTVATLQEIAEGPYKAEQMAAWIDRTMSQTSSVLAEIKASK